MKLIQETIVSVTDKRIETFKAIRNHGGSRWAGLEDIAQARSLTTDQVFEEITQDLKDFLVVATIARNAQTVLFSADQGIALRPALARFSDQPFFRLPFPHMIIQFDKPIPEEIFFTVEPDYWTEDPRLEKIRDIIANEQSLQNEYKKMDLDPLSEQGDKIAAIVLDQDGDTCNAVAWYTSGEIQRVMWKVYDLDVSKNMRPPDVGVYRDLKLRNKQQLQSFSMACVFYMNCRNITLEKVVADKKINAGRAKRGKRLLPDYHICKVVKTKYDLAGDGEASGDKTGHKHTIRYDVRGHFRNVGDGVIWIGDHQRGLSNERYVPKTYKVNKEE